MKYPLVAALLFSCQIFLSGCGADFADKSQSLKLSWIEYKSNSVYEETGQLGGPAWVSEEYIAFVYDPPYFEGYPQDSRLHLYNMVKNEWNEIGPSFVTTFSPKNDILYFGMLSRLPNENLGISYVSFGDGNRTGRPKIQGIVEYDLNTGNVIRIVNQFDENVIGVLGGFSYSPDMTELIQEDGTGMLLNTKLYYIDSSNRATQIVPDLIRADAPDWSPHKREIAFWGTETLPGGMHPTQIANHFDLIRVVHAPWDLYLSAPDGSNLRRVVSSVREHRPPKWSPTQENILAFSGIYDGTPGIWLLDLSALQLSRIYPDFVNGYDWSPDGTRIVFIKETSDMNDFPLHKYIIGIIDVVH
jgi:WD40 repeat protein